jgi:hypothetical protein
MAKKQISDYCENIKRPFHISYNHKNGSIEVDRKIKTIDENEEESGHKF